MSTRVQEDIRVAADEMHLSRIGTSGMSEHEQFVHMLTWALEVLRRRGWTVEPGTDDE